MSFKRTNCESGQVGRVYLLTAALLAILVASPLLGMADGQAPSGDEIVLVNADREFVEWKESAGLWPGPSTTAPSTTSSTAFSLRTITSQMGHHDAITTFAATITEEAARSESYEVFDLQPASCSIIGYTHYDINYMVHPDAAAIGRAGTEEGTNHWYCSSSRLPNQKGPSCASPPE